MSSELAGCVITNQVNHVLLLHRNTPLLTQWELPGGKVETGETAKDAARREILEEIGVHVGIIGVLGVAKFDQDGTQWSYTWLRARITEGVPSPCEPHKHDAVSYFDLHNPETITADVSKNIQALIEAIQNNRVTL